MHRKTHDTSLELMVQFQRESERMKIEDAMTEESESDSGFRRVATVLIPSQDLPSEESRAFRASCEGLSFNPWHALADHQPLGGLNRLKRTAYEASFKRRLPGREAASQRPTVRGLESRRIRHPAAKRLDAGYAGYFPGES